MCVWRLSKELTRNIQIRVAQLRGQARSRNAPLIEMRNNPKYTPPLAPITSHTNGHGSDSEEYSATSDGEGDVRSVTSSIASSSTSVLRSAGLHLPHHASRDGSGSSSSAGGGEDRTPFRFHSRGLPTWAKQNLTENDMSPSGSDNPWSQPRPVSRWKPTRFTLGQQRVSSSSGSSGGDTITGGSGGGGRTSSNSSRAQYRLMGTIDQDQTFTPTSSPAHQRPFYSFRRSEDFSDEDSSHTARSIDGTSHRIRSPSERKIDQLGSRKNMTMSMINLSGVNDGNNERTVSLADLSTSARADLARSLTDLRELDGDESSIPHPDSSADSNPIIWWTLPDDAESNDSSNSPIYRVVPLSAADVRKLKDEARRLRRGNDETSTITTTTSNSIISDEVESCDGDSLEEERTDTQSTFSNASTPPDSDSRQQIFLHRHYDSVSQSSDQTSSTAALPNGHNNQTVKTSAAGVERGEGRVNAHGRTSITACFLASRSPSGAGGGGDDDDDDGGSDEVGSPRDIIRQQQYRTMRAQQSQIARAKDEILGRLQSLGYSKQGEAGAGMRLGGRAGHGSKSDMRSKLEEMRKSSENLRRSTSLDDICDDHGSSGLSWRRSTLSPSNNPDGSRRPFNQDLSRSVSTERINSLLSQRGSRLSHQNNHQQHHPRQPVRATHSMPYNVDAENHNISEDPSSSSSPSSKSLSRFNSRKMDKAFISTPNLTSIDEGEMSRSEEDVHEVSQPPQHEKPTDPHHHHHPHTGSSSEKMEGVVVLNVGGGERRLPPPSDDLTYLSLAADGLTTDPLEMSVTDDEKQAKEFRRHEAKWRERDQSSDRELVKGESRISEKIKSLTSKFEVPGRSTPSPVPTLVSSTSKGADHTLDTVEQSHRVASNLKNATYEAADMYQRVYKSHEMEPFEREQIMKILWDSFQSVQHSVEGNARSHIDGVKDADLHALKSLLGDKESGQQGLTLIKMYSDLLYQTLCHRIDHTQPKHNQK